MLVSCHYDEAPAGLTTFMSIRKEYIDIPTSLETPNADNTVGYFFLSQNYQITCIHFYPLLRTPRRIISQVMTGM